MLTMRWSTFNEQFEVFVDGEWAGNVWATTRGDWTAQDWDGDTDNGFSNFLSAGQWVQEMRAALV